MARIHCRQYVGTKTSAQVCVARARAYQSDEWTCLSLVARRVGVDAADVAGHPFEFVIGPMCFSMVFDVSFFRIITMLTFLRTV